MDVFKELSNGDIAIGTNPRGAKVALYSCGRGVNKQNMHTAYKETHSIEFGGDHIEDIVEQESGVLLVLTKESPNDYKITALTPQFPQEKNLDFKIEELELKIKHFPDQLDNYKELGKRLSDRKSEMPALNVFFSAIKPALLRNDFYSARRFFENAYLLADDHEKIRVIGHYKSLLAGQCKKEHRRLDLLLFQLGKLSRDVFPVQRKCKSRLIVGDGNFSYTEALIKKHGKTHERLAKAITTTELRRPTDEETTRMTGLKEKGVTVLSEVDATKLHERFKGKRFKRIQWNFPYSSILNDTKSHQGVMQKFFRSAAQLQEEGDRIHVTLKKDNNADRWWSENEAVRNPILIASHAVDYRLVRKRSFPVAERYDGYVQAKSETGEELRYYGLGVEFIFAKQKLAGQREKLPICAQEEVLKKGDLKRFSIVEKNIIDSLGATQQEYSYYECSTDEESSDYYETDSDLESGNESEVENAEAIPDLESSQAGKRKADDDLREQENSKRSKEECE